MSVRLGTISVDLVANTVSFSDAMSRASQISLNSSKNIQRSLTMVTAAATAMATGVIASLTASINKAEDFAFTMSKFAEKTGTSVEMMSKLAYSAKLAGVPIDMVKGAMERLARTSGAAQGGQKEAIAAYSTLGISVKDLQGPLSSSGDLLVAVSKKLATMSDSTRKTYIEQKILGRTGSELAPMLSTLGATFDENSKQAELFGVVLDQETAEKAKALHQTVAQLESVMMGFSIRLLSGVAPALTEVGNKLENFATSTDGMKMVSGVADTLASSVRGVGNAFEFLTEHATAVKVLLGSLATLQVGSIFLPMISSAAKAGTGFDTIGLAATKMIGRASGITQVGAALAPLAKSVTGTATAWVDLARTEGRAAAASYALAEASESVTASLRTLEAVAVGATGQFALLATGLGIVAYKFHEVSAAAMASEPDGGKWADVWNGGILGVKNNVELLIARWHQLRGVALSDTDKSAISRGFNGESQSDLIRQAGQNRRGVSDSIYAMIHAPDLKPMAAATAKADAPVIPQVQTAKIDIVAKKLMELRDAAQASQKALADAGKGPSFERADEAAKEAKHTIDELNESLKVHGKSLTEAQKAQIIADTTTTVNNNSQAAYRTALLKTTEELVGQANAQEILNRAIGNGAKAVEDAAVASFAAREDAGKDSEWLEKNKAMRDARNQAYRESLRTSNRGNDAQSVVGVQAEINAQKQLNDVLGKGKDAIDAMTLANQQAAIVADFTRRGDNNITALQAALDAAREEFDLKKKGQDLERTAQFNPFQNYQDQKNAIDATVQAAQEAKIAIDQMAVAAARKANWEAYIESVDKAILATGTLKDGTSVFFQEMGRQSVSAAQQMHDVLSSAFEDLNSSLSNLMTGQNASFSQFFRGMAAHLSQTGLKNLEGGIAHGLFGEKSQDPVVQELQKSQDYLAQIAANTAGTGLSKGSLILDPNSDSSDVAKSVGLSSGLLSTLTSFIPGAGLFSGLFGFGGHRALGGDVKAGMTYDVGEMGRETFTPSQDGKITPNNKLGGNNYYSISVPNGMTPEQFHQTMSQLIPQIRRQAAGDAVKAMSERERRKPATAGR